MCQSKENYFDNRQVVSVNICWFQLLKFHDSLLFFFIYDVKKRVWVFGWTKEVIWRLHVGLWETVMSIFFWHRQLVKIIVIDIKHRYQNNFPDSALTHVLWSLPVKCPGIIGKCKCQWICICLSYLYLGKRRTEGTWSTMNSHGRSLRATFTLRKQNQDVLLTHFSRKC